MDVEQEIREKLFGRDNKEESEDLNTCVCGYINARYFGSNCTMTCYYRNNLI